MHCDRHQLARVGRVLAVTSHPSFQCHVSLGYWMLFAVLLSFSTRFLVLVFKLRMTAYIAFALFTCVQQSCDGPLRRPVVKLPFVTAPGIWSHSIATKVEHTHPTFLFYYIFNFLYIFYSFSLLGRTFLLINSFPDLVFAFTLFLRLLLQLTDISVAIVYLCQVVKNERLKQA